MNRFDDLIQFENKFDNFILKLGLFGYKSGILCRNFNNLKTKSQDFVSELYDHERDSDFSCDAFIQVFGGILQILVQLLNFGLELLTSV